VSKDRIKRILKKKKAKKIQNVQIKATKLKSPLKSIKTGIRRS